MQALLTLIGIVVASLLTFLLTRRNEFEKHKRQMLTDAYADYLRALADGRYLNANSNEAEISARMTDAKARICLYGPAEVVAHLAAFERAGGAILTPDQHNLFAELVSRMRDDSSVEQTDLESILFSNRSHNNSLDRSGGSVFRIEPGAAKG